MMDDEAKRIKRNKILLGLGAVGIVLLLVVIIVIAIINNNESDYTEPESSIGELIGDKKKKFVVFYNSDILINMYGIEISSRVMEDFEEIVLSDEEMKFSKNNSPVEDNSEVYYDATIDLSSLFSYDGYTCSFDVKMSDSREYPVIIRTDSFDDDFTYFYMAITREGGEKIFVVLSGNDGGLAAFVDFVKSEMGKTSVELVSTNLEEN